MAAVPKLRVAVVVQSSRGYGREVIDGIARFSRIHRTWSIYHDERVILDPVPQWLHTWDGEGLLGGIETEPLAELIRQKKVPAVDLHGEYPIEGVPKVRPDQAAAIRMAYDHLTEVGFRRIGYCGFEGVGYSSEREVAYRELVEAEGCEPAVINSRYPHKATMSRIEADGFLEQDALVKWLLSLEKPHGVIACNDIRGSQVINACRAADISVPDEIGVIGIDNDLCVCGLCDPPLTSVDLNAAYIGFVSAELLNDIMRDKPPSEEAYLIEPTGVVVRQSTSLFVIEDESIAQAMRFIRDNASAGIGVDDVVGNAHLSRSTLERRFKRLVGRSIKAEINRHRLAHLKELLETTDFPLGQIATLVGFSQAEYMIAFFRKSVGMTPGEYRKGHSVWGE